MYSCVPPPGTKWCGKGDSAEHEDDLGIYAREDSCCRTHDRCKRFIISGQKQTFYTLSNDSYDITNEHIYTM